MHRLKLAVVALVACWVVLTAYAVLLRPPVLLEELLTRGHPRVEKYWQSAQALRKMKEDNADKLLAAKESGDEFRIANAERVDELHVEAMEAFYEERQQVFWTLFWRYSAFGAVLSVVLLVGTSYYERTSKDPLGVLKES